MHALVTLNDPAYIEAARVLAQRALMREMKTESRLESVFRDATARAPTAREASILLARLDKLREHYTSATAAAHQLASAGEFPRPGTIPVIEHAAWTALCALILNLDETLSKE
jgi:hypothetical protein